MLFLIAFVGAAVIALVLWKAMNSAQPPSRAAAAPTPAAAEPRPRVSGPDDDPEFLRQLDEKVRKRDDAARLTLTGRSTSAGRSGRGPSNASATAAASSSSASRVRRLQPVQVHLGALLEVRVERDPHHRAAARREVLGHPVQVHPARPSGARS